MNSEEQLGLWLLGMSIHNDEADECCPDFSCCDYTLLAPYEEREMFVDAKINGKENIVMRMLASFLGRMITRCGIRAYITDGRHF